MTIGKKKMRFSRLQGLHYSTAADAPKIPMGKKPISALAPLPPPPSDTLLERLLKVLESR